jgi:hypothetical protein
MHDYEVVGALQGIVHLTGDILVNTLTDVEKLSVQVSLIEIAASYALHVLDDSERAEERPSADLAVEA